MLPIAGRVDATIAQVVPVTIHGDRYVDLVLDHAQGRDAARVPLHAFARHPAVGDRVRLTVLLGQVDSVEHLL
ncbi:MAG: hypothetical protein U0572_17730 [Phycisphaerales bacterium]